MKPTAVYNENLHLRLCCNNGRWNHRVYRFAFNTPGLDSGKKKRASIACPLLISRPLDVLVSRRNPDGEPVVLEGSLPSTEFCLSVCSLLGELDLSRPSVDIRDGEDAVTVHPVVVLQRNRLVTEKLYGRVRPVGLLAQTEVDVVG